jgi:hypothetical protein
LAFFGFSFAFFFHYFSMLFWGLLLPLFAGIICPLLWDFLLPFFGLFFGIYLALCFRGFLKVWGSFMDVLEALQGWSIFSRFWTKNRNCPRVNLPSQNTQLKSAVCPQEDVASVMGPGSIVAIPRLGARSRDDRTLQP